VTIYLTDMAHFPAIVDLRARYFTPPYPADTIVEVRALALPELMIENWYGMIAPAGTPSAIIAALNKVTLAALADPGVKERLAEQGLTTAGNSPDQFRDFIASETAKWAKVIKDSGNQTTR